MFKLMSKEEVAAKSILNNLKNLKEKVKMRRSCVLRNQSVMAKIGDLKEGCVESLRCGVDKALVKFNFAVNVKGLVKHNCELCKRSKFDMDHDFEEFGTDVKIEEFWLEIWDEFINYENHDYMDDYDFEIYEN